MIRPALTIPLAAALAVVIAGCGGGDADRSPGASAPSPLRGAKAQAAPSIAAGTLAGIPDGDAVRGRLAYVNVTALAAAELPVSFDDVAGRVLGRGATRLAGRKRTIKTIVQVGPDVSVLQEAKAGRIVLGATPSLSARLADSRHERSAITPAAASAAQSCLGETLAQTIIGPRAMGADAALGVGLAESGDPPRGLQLRICGAPRLRRHVHAMERTLRARFGDGGGPGRAPRIAEQEIGEREIVGAAIAADAVEPAQLLALLAGGDELRRLAWR